MLFRWIEANSMFFTICESFSHWRNKSRRTCHPRNTRAAALSGWSGLGPGERCRARLRIITMASNASVVSRSSKSNRGPARCALPPSVSPEVTKPAGARQENRADRAIARAAPTPGPFHAGRGKAPLPPGSGENARTLPAAGQREAPPPRSRDRLRKLGAKG